MKFTRFRQKELKYKRTFLRKLGFLPENSITKLKLIMELTKYFSKKNKEIVKKHKMHDCGDEELICGIAEL